MKKKIIELGKKYHLDLVVVSNREAFDIIDYEVYHNNNFIGVYRYYSGKTSTCVEYPIESFLPELENELENYKLKIVWRSTIPGLRIFSVIKKRSGGLP